MLVKRGQEAINMFQLNRKERALIHKGAIIVYVGEFASDEKTEAEHKRVQQAAFEESGHNVFEHGKTFDDLQESCYDYAWTLIPSEQICHFYDTLKKLEFAQECDTCQELTTKKIKCDLQCQCHGRGCYCCDSCVSKYNEELKH